MVYSSVRCFLISVKPATAAKILPVTTNAKSRMPLRRIAREIGFDLRSAARIRCRRMSWTTPSTANAAARIKGVTVTLPVMKLYPDKANRSANTQVTPAEKLSSLYS